MKNLVFAVIFVVLYSFSIKTLIIDVDEKFGIKKVVAFIGHLLCAFMCFYFAWINVDLFYMTGTMPIENTIGVILASVGLALTLNPMLFLSIGVLSEE